MSCRRKSPQKYKDPSQNGWQCEQERGLYAERAAEAVCGQKQCPRRRFGFLGISLEIHDSAAHKQVREHPQTTIGCINPLSVPSSDEQLALDSRLETLCQQFIAHNLHSGNLGTLIDVFLAKVTELLALSDSQQNNVHVWQTFNALFIIRTLVKYMIETCSEYQLLQQFEAKPTPGAPQEGAGQQNGSSGGASAAIQSPFVGSKFEAFVEAIINLVVVIPVK